MKCIVIDDDQLSLQILVEYINRTKELDLLGTFDNAVPAINFLKKSQVDVVFLDVEMPQLTGIELMENFNLPNVVLMSTEAEYAAKGFDHDVTDFLTKPVNYARFLKAVSKLNLPKNTGEFGNEPPENSVWNW